MLVQPLYQVIDFLGCRVFVGHRRVRPRVVQHCKAKLAEWAAQHVKTDAHGTTMHANAVALANLQSMLGSYWGHFAHANSVRLRRALLARFAWLNALFTLSPKGELHGRWVLQGETFAAQAAALQAQWPAAQCLIQKGYQWVELLPLQPAMQPTTATAHPARVRAVQTGWLLHGTRRREITHWFIPHSTPPLI